MAENQSVDLEVIGLNPGRTHFLFQFDIHTFGEIIFHAPFKDISVDFLLKYMS